MKRLEKLQQNINITFTNISILQEALTHRSYLNENKNYEGNHNERFEFLGDAVLELVTTELLFQDYPDFPEGDLTSFRSALVRTESLADESKRLDIGGALFLSRGEEATGGRERPYILANAMEALIGAIYLDKGYDRAKLFIKEHIYFKISKIIKNRLDIDAKSKLQEISQDELRITPMYILISEKGPDHNKVFTMGVQIGEFIFAQGTGVSKQSAEQQAAQSALDEWESLKSKNFPINT